MTTEGIIYQARLHWILYVGPIVFFIVDLYIGSQYPLFYSPALLCGVMIAIWLLLTWSMIHFSTLTLIEKHLILRTGIIVRQTIDIPLSKIESIDIRQSVIGMLFGYGMIMITGTGGTHEVINYIKKPLTCRRYIEQAINN